MTLGGPVLERVSRLGDLRVGELISEGGEGRVFELPLQPYLVYKAYRNAMSRPVLDDLVAWPATALGGPEMQNRVGTGSAWPTSVVVDPAGEARGLLLPRAPRRFGIRHRDGTTRLASLSYLTADPAHRAVAYGIRLPGPASRERIGLAYALARLLEAFESGAPRIGHGDLSTKNVLWSMQRGPEVFVIDCDNSETFDGRGTPLRDSGRRRAMTPNWDDPAVVPGHNPTVYSDRYSMALIFLRVVGAANFPVQARQRSGGTVSVDFGVPPAAFSDQLLGPRSPVWPLCVRGLSLADPRGRPAPSEWVEILEGVLRAGGASEIVDSVQRAQSGPGPTVVSTGSRGSTGSTGSARATGWTGSGGEMASRASDPVAQPAGEEVGDEPDVLITPVVRRVEEQPKYARLHAAPPPTTPWLRPFVVPGSSGVSPSGGVAGTPGPAAGHGPSGGPGSPGASSPGFQGPSPLGAPGTVRVLPQLIAQIQRGIRWWAHLHASAFATARRPGDRSEGARAIGVCVLIDIVLLVMGVFLTAMLVAPILGI